MKKLILILTAVLISTAMYAQDRIYKRNGEILEAKVTEIGDFEIKYKSWDNQEGPTYVVETNKIKKILFATGDVKIFDEDHIVPLALADQRKNVIKVGFLDPLAGFTSVTYERSIKPGRSWEATLGIIGLGVDINDNNPRGASARFGYKFIKSPDHYIRGMKSAHILKGAYVKPEVIFSAFGEDYREYDPWMNRYTTIRNQVTAGALLLTFGKQLVYDNAFAIDYYFSIGYGFSNSTNVDERPYGNNYGFAGGDKDMPIAINAGLRIGGLFGR